MVIGIYLYFVICDLVFTTLHCHSYFDLTMKTIRQQIVALLTVEEMDARQLSREVGVKEKDVYEHLSHIARTTAAKGSQLMITPSECLHCGYVFKDRKRFTRPSRCPRCRQSRLTTPTYRIKMTIEN